MSDYYTPTGNPVGQSRGTSATQRSEFTSIQTGFDKLPAPASVWGNKAHYGVDTGVADAYLVTVASTYLTSYTDGMCVKVKALNANTGAATINVNSLGVKSLTRPDGTDLQVGDIVSGQSFEITYNATTGKFQLMNAYGGPAGPTGTLAGNASAGINFLAGPSIASAATLSGIWTGSQGNEMVVTGTTTTSSFGTAPQAGASRVLIANAAWPITAGANLLIPGVASGATYTCEAGDIITVHAITTTQFRLEITKQNGMAAAPGILQVSKSQDYTCVIGDEAKHIFHPSADTTPRTFTIPANSSVPFPIGAALTFVNQNGAGTITIAITTDTMRLAGVGTTGSRTLPANGIATALKITATEWLISGVGLT